MNWAGCALFSKNTELVDRLVSKYGHHSECIAFIENKKVPFKDSVAEFSNYSLNLTALSVFLEKGADIGQCDSFLEEVYKKYFSYFTKYEVKEKQEAFLCFFNALLMNRCDTAQHLSKELYKIKKGNRESYLFQLLNSLELTRNNCDIIQAMIDKSLLLHTIEPSAPPGPVSQRIAKI